MKKEMEKEKWVALNEEFPFLQAVAEKVKFDWRTGEVQISRMDKGFLEKTPIDEIYESYEGPNRIRELIRRHERLFVVRKNGKIREVKLQPDIRRKLAFKKPKIQNNGQTFLAALTRAGIEEFDCLVWYQYSYFADKEEFKKLGRNYGIITILRA